MSQQVRVMFQDYQFPQVQSETGSNLATDKSTIIEGNRGDGSIYIPGGKKSQRIIIKGILVGDDYNDLTNQMHEMKTNITTGLGVLKLQHKGAVDIGLDFMEYTSDGAAQAAYVSSEADVLDQSQTLSNDMYSLRLDTNSVAFGQGIKVTGEELTKVSLYINKVGSPTGDIWIEIQGDNGGVPNNSVISNGTSSTIDVSTVGTSSAWKDFTFPTNPYLTTGTQYHIVLKGDFTIDGSNYINWFMQDTNPYTNGNIARYNGSTWIIDGYATNWDACFKTYTVSLQCYSEPSLKTQGSYSLKTVAKGTDSLNETLTKSGLSIDLSGVNILNFEAYAHWQTGAPLRLKIHNSGGATHTKDIFISVADTWETIIWDISGIADVNKDDIDQIIIEVMNADETNTVYIDNFIIPSAEAPLSWINDWAYTVRRIGEIEFEESLRTDSQPYSIEFLVISYT